MAPKILIFDIETAPILSWVWSLWDQNVGLNQIKNDWYVMAFAAKWLGDKKIHYYDLRDEKNPEDDKILCERIWRLLDEADIIVTQNGKKFDEKKLNSRFIIHGLKPPSSYRHIDTLQLAKKNFAFTSNKLAYLSDKLCEHKKSEHKKYPGFELWSECLKGNKGAWKEMEKYNKQDVRALEEVYKKLMPWDRSFMMSVYGDNTDRVCSCGGRDWMANGYEYTPTGKYHRLQCKNCGKRTKTKMNLLDKEKRSTL